MTDEKILFTIGGGSMDFYQLVESKEGRAVIIREVDNPGNEIEIIKLALPKLIEALQGVWNRK